MNDHVSDRMPTAATPLTPRRASALAPPPVRRRTAWTISIVAVCLAAVLPYLSTLNNYFAQDDFGVVQLLAGKPWSYFPRWFTTTWMDAIWGFIPDEIRPFPAVTYQFTALWGGGSPVANHVVNIAFHAANGLLVLAAARMAAGLGVVASTFAALVFVLLPVQAESVAWITGRVDTIPAFFYVASFLFYVWWRQQRSASRYVASLVLFFIALFSKQNTITMVPALIAYDLLIERRYPWPARKLIAWAAPYVPFALLTIGYLYLRYLLFGEVARDSQLAQSIEFFRYVVPRHLRRLFLGDVTPGARLVPIAIGAAVAMLAAIVIWGRQTRLARRATGASDRRPAGATAPSASSSGSSSIWGALLYFGPVWLTLGIAPIAAANYESPRHVYLASLGWAIVLGIVLEVLWQTRPHRIVRPAATLAAAALLSLHTVQLSAAVAQWHTNTSVSKKAVADLEREALALPEGSLVIAGAPASSWEWSIPFAAQPPFTTTDISRRVRLVTPMKLHCCRAQWNAHTRHILATWTAQPNRPPLVALHWDAKTGRLSKITDRDDPSLYTMVLVLLETPNANLLDTRLQELLDKLVAGRYVR